MPSNLPGSSGDERNEPSPYPHRGKIRFRGWVAVALAAAAWIAVAALILFLVRRW